MPSHKEIVAFLTGAASDAARLAEYRLSTTAARVALSTDMAAMLGAANGERRLIPFLDTVIEAIAAKLFVKQVTAEGATVTKAIAGWLGDTRWALIERELYRVVSRDSAAYILTAWNDGPEFHVRERYNGSHGAGTVREHGTVAFTFNTWQAGEQTYLDLYYPGRIEKYAKKAEGEWAPRRDAPDEEWPIPWLAHDGSPLGPALIEFSIGSSDIESALQVARDLNEAVLDMVAVSRLQGWPQRFLKGKRNISVLTTPEGQPLLTSAGRPIPRRVELRPGSVMLLDQDAELSQLAGAAPATAAVDKLLALLSWLTTVPTHYFTGDWPSGVALLNSELRLNHKVEGHQGRLTSAIVQLVRLCLRLSNHYGSTAFDVNQRITVEWYPPQVESVELQMERRKAEAEYVEKLFAAGLMSREEALAVLHPDWSKERLADELARLQAPLAALSPQEVPA